MSGPPQRWPGSGCGKSERCTDDELHVIRLCSRTWALRQDKCVTVEAPVMFLMVGDECALLLDTGDVRQDGGWLHKTLDRLVPEGIPLLVHATHPHSDHVAGHDMMRRWRPGSTRVMDEPLPDEHVIHLGGGRQVTVLHAGKGHSAWDVCFLDSETRYLFTGDVLYPGYLFIRNYDSYKEGMSRLHARVKGKYVLSFGAHIEMSRGQGLYPTECRMQGDEVPLQQEPKVLDELVRVLLQPAAPMTSSFALCPRSNL